MVSRSSLGPALCSSPWHVACQAHTHHQNGNLEQGNEGAEHSLADAAQAMTELVRAPV